MTDQLRKLVKMRAILSQRRLKIISTGQDDKDLLRAYEDVGTNQPMRSEFSLDLKPDASRTAKIAAVKTLIRAIEFDQQQCFLMMADLVKNTFGAIQRLENYYVAFQEPPNSELRYVILKYSADLFWAGEKIQWKSWPKKRPRRTEIDADIQTCEVLDVLFSAMD